jgi:hypothetical protein
VSQVVPARLAQIAFNKQYKDNENTTGEDDNKTPGTMLTGFVGDKNENDQDITAGDITDKFTGNPIVVDKDTAAQELINHMCPSGKTPLGVHLAALADQIGDGTPENPNKIMVISDGESNVGDEPIDVANAIHLKYPNLQIDIIDTTKNENLPQISAITGGIYSQASEGNAILDKMMKFSGICGSKLPKYTPITPTPTCSRQSGAVPVGTQQANNGNGGNNGNGNNGNNHGNGGNGNGNGKGGKGKS